ncbi:MAG: S8 family serine peptidase [Acidobacteria bacterium]|nr:S8 family serine peptidase [Acidobacteriota bacterium]
MKEGRFLFLAILVSLIAPAATGQDSAEIRRPRVKTAGIQRPKVVRTRTYSPVVQPSSVTVDVLGVAPSAVNGSVAATDPQSLPLAFSITGLPKHGTVSITPDTGAFTFSIAGHTQSTGDLFRVAVSNGSAQSIARVNVKLASDPLLQNQWHIQNVGQDAFASVLPVYGNDMNVAGAWTAGYSGRGIKVGVVDTGLEAAHEDLAANVDIGNSFNFLTGLNDPSPDPTEPGFDHGTAVAGIIGATAFNGKGGRGVAYNSRLRGYNLLSYFSIANMAKSMGSDPISADNDLFNASFGDSAPSLPTFSGAFQAITGTTLELRNGLGAAIVNAAGNDFEDWEYWPGTGLCDNAYWFNVSCGDPANDERRGGYAPIIVGAIDADGKHSSYSNTGSSLWISAPGGEYGLNSDYTPDTNYAPAVVTTSRTGCAHSAFPDPVNPLDSKGANQVCSGLSIHGRHERHKRRNAQCRRCHRNDA